MWLTRSLEEGTGREETFVSRSLGPQAVAPRRMILLASVAVAVLGALVSSQLPATATIKTPPCSASVEPANTPGPIALSCPATGSCVAASFFFDSHGNQQGVMESQAGSSWTAVTAPVSGLSPPAGGNPQARLTGL